MQEKNKIKYYSLYEHLGHAAGKQLGGDVYKAAQKAKQPVTTQLVEQGGYKGKVLCYTKGFLNEYFKKQLDNAFLPDGDEDDDLPF